MSDERLDSTPPDQPGRDASGERPVLWGLVALAAVTVVVGAIMGGGALVAARAMGLSNDPAASSESTGNETLFLPKPEKTEVSDDPAYTFSAEPEPEPSSSPEESDDPDDGLVISLSASQTAVGVMERIDLTGTYPGGEGSILRVQQFEGGIWTDFPVTVPVSGNAFSTFIQASAVGLNRFRVINTDNGETSNDVRVQIG